MKHILLIGDGMADYPIDEIGGKTPLEKAYTPFMDGLAGEGITGRVQTVPEGFSPGSDVAILSILGYNPEIYYTGRAPLEAAAMGIKLSSSEIAFRCNLVTLVSKNGRVVMDDFSAGHISTEEASPIIETLEKKIGSQSIAFYPGVSYRHLMVLKDKINELKTTPPHDIIGKEIVEFMPRGKGSKLLLSLMSESRRLLKDHPVNKERERKGLRPANSIWLWGEGKSPDMPTFEERFGINGAVISAVNLVKGLGVYAGLKIVDVPGVTGYLDTNYKGKAEFSLRELSNKELVIVHVEAPDEAGHAGDVKAKIRAIEDFDREIIGRILNGINLYEDVRILILCDHPTPISLRTHTNEPVPFIIYDRSHPKRNNPKKTATFSERMSTELYIKEGHTLMDTFLKRKTVP